MLFCDRYVHTNITRTGTICSTILAWLSQLWCHQLMGYFNSIMTWRDPCWACNLSSCAHDSAAWNVWVYNNSSVNRHDYISSFHLWLSLAHCACHTVFQKALLFSHVGFWFFFFSSPYLCGAFLASAKPSGLLPFDSFFFFLDVMVVWMIDVPLYSLAFEYVAPSL